MVRHFARSGLGQAALAGPVERAGAIIALLAIQPGFPGGPIGQAFGIGSIRTRRGLRHRLRRCRIDRCISWTRLGGRIIRVHRAAIIRGSIGRQRAKRSEGGEGRNRNGNHFHLSFLVRPSATGAGRLVAREQGSMPHVFPDVRSYLPSLRGCCISWAARHSGSPCSRAKHGCFQRPNVQQRSEHDTMVRAHQDGFIWRE